MLNPYVILGLIVLWAVSLFGVGKWQYGVGSEHERVTWQAREVAQVTAANAKIQALNDAARAKEHEHEQRVAEISTKFLKERTDREARARRDFDDALTGALRLHVRATCSSPGGGASGETRPGPGGGDGTTVVELPPTVTANLFRLADDADQVADQLRAAQKIIEEDRKVCG